jgi:hypothetical protein
VGMEFLEQLLRLKVIVRNCVSLDVRRVWRGTGDW